ncbi:MAG: galactokinase [Eubacteriales bacterium]
MITETVKAAVAGGAYDKAFTALYGAGADLAGVRARYLAAIDSFEALYGADLAETCEVRLFSVPGRSEISGNHTDHNHGRVLAASISLDIIAVAAATGKNEIRIKSEGFDEDTVSLDDVQTVRPDEKYKASAIIRGMCDGFVRGGRAVGGFVAYTTSNVLKGSGLSSSAAFEDMVGNLLNHFFNGGKVDAVEIAKTAQYAENVHFGKPCGLMDQTACAVGGFVAIDFKNPADPVVEKLPFDLDAAGLSLCIVNTGGNHADLNEDYASVPADMKAAAKFLGADVLADTTKEALLAKAAEIRAALGDMCFLRALHFFNENKRVAAQRDALEKGDLAAFLARVRESGLSSATKLQNVYTVKNVKEQGLTVALALAGEVLDGVPNSAYRVHGGGFAGTIQAFVPKTLVNAFIAAEEAVFGKGSVYVLSVRPYGAVALDALD